MFDLTKRRDFVAAAVLFEGGLIGIAVVLGWWFEVAPLARLSWNVAAVGWALGATIPMFALFLVMSRYPVGPLRRIKQFLFEALGPSLLACRWYDLLLVAALAGIGEELLFRGVLQPLMNIFWSNLVFGLAHFITPTYFVLAGLLGAYLGWLLECSGNILAPVIAHGLYDFLAFLAVACELRRERAHAHH